MVECLLTDIHGCLWSFIEKVPIVTEVPLDDSSTYPQPGVIGCQVIGRVDGKARIDTELPWHIESVEGETRFEVSEMLLVEWESPSDQ